MSNTRKGLKMVVILGQTATGKSDLGVRLARKFGGEIISADSRQVYKGLNIGSGKITKKDMLGIPHYLLDVASPKQRFTVAKFQKLGKNAIAKIIKNEKIPFIVGGTGMYIDALMYNQTLPEVKPNIPLRKKLEKRTAEELFKLIQAKDPARAKNIDPYNKRRLVRALEIIEDTQQAIPTLKKESTYDVLWLGLKLNENMLKERIAARLQKRIRTGMTHEAKKLIENGVSYKRLDELGLEYRYVAKYLKGELTKIQMIEILNKEIWHFAKRQMTWFKRNPSINWLASPKEADRLISKFIKNNPDRGRD